MKRISKNIHTSVSEARSLAQDIAPQLKGGEVLALVGNLGAGKTTFTQALAAELGITHAVSSPTFVLAQTYPIPDTHIHLDHFDLYRLESEDEISQSGLTEHWGSPHNISVIEWADKAKSLLPPHTTYIYFS